MNFKTWINTLVSEKGIDTETIITVDGASGENMIPVGCLIDAIIAASARERAAIKDTLVKIDFINGDIMHYFKHLAHAIAI